FKFECPKQWDRLKPTGVDGVRFCESCQQNVYYSNTIEEAQRHALVGLCVAVDARLTRREADLDVSLNMTEGVISGMLRIPDELPPPPPITPPREGWLRRLFRRFRSS